MLTIDRLIKQPNALPAAPKVVRKLIETFEQPEVDVLKVAAYVAAEPVLTAKLLRMANSAFFGLTRSVCDVRSAINVLGLIKVRALVIAASLDDCFHMVGGVNLNQFWRYSLNTANLSRYLAMPIQVDESAAFTAGLVHAIGELVMHVGMPEDMLELDRSVPMLDLRRARVQLGAFGYSYADVGAALAREWKFPRKMIDAIQHQVAPFENDAYEPIAGVVHIAAWRARAEELALPADALIGSYPDPVGLVLGIDPDTVIGGNLPMFARADEGQKA